MFDDAGRRCTLYPYGDTWYGVVLSCEMVGEVESVGDDGQDLCLYLRLVPREGTVTVEVRGGIAGAVVRWLLVRVWWPIMARVRRRWGDG